MEGELLLERNEVFERAISLACPDAMASLLPKKKKMDKIDVLSFALLLLERSAQHVKTDLDQALAYSDGALLLIVRERISLGVQKLSKTYAETGMVML